MMVGSAQADYSLSIRLMMRRIVATVAEEVRPEGQASGQDVTNGWLYTVAMPIGGCCWRTDSNVLRQLGVSNQSARPQHFMAIQERLRVV